MDNKKLIKALTFVDNMKLGKNVRKYELDMVIKAFPKAVKRYLLENTELVFGNFFKIGYRIKAEQETFSTVLCEKMTMPEHKRMKCVWYQDLKNYLNS